ncbi:MAG: exo-alpha-sialidase [Chloroflexi bacterium]|nr:MAG: exo-alpha-sialidase [Chloroflexota bacterium]
MHRIARLALPAIAILVVGLIGGSAASPSSGPTKQDVAKKILNSPAGKTLSAPARAYMESVARGDHRLAPDSNGLAQKGNKVNSAKPGGGGSLTNVRVNNPANDTHQTDQTTQSETTVGVSGSNVVVGYNTSSHTLLFLTAGSNLTGYAYSADGGQTFTDGGVIPNAPGNVNLGDPWLASDSAGNFYYSTLTIDATTGFLLVGTSKSTDGGKTFSQAASIPPPPVTFFYSADKDALAAGPGTGNLYDVWDDFSVDSNFNEVSGLPVAHSTDGGQTWSIHYASQVPIFGTGCSFAQYIGAQPLVVDANTIYDAAELIKADDPNCTGVPLTYSEAVFVSHDGGTTWSAGSSIPITSSTQNFGAFVLGPAQYMRNLEFPTLAAFHGSAYMAWNDGGDGSGHSHIRLAQLDGSGKVVGSPSFITSGTNDEAQPALSADSNLHVGYYQISTDSNGNGQLDVLIANSSNAKKWSIQRVTSQSFPGVFTLPQFDPIIAFGYMGDYIAQVSDGTHQYIAWGDNRDIVTNFLWPNGRHDPDVFFARQ